MDPLRLDDLIELVRSRSDDDPLAQLQQAAVLKDEVADLSDALLGHFVDQARRSGATWSQIGDALGVSKQAAQQRHASPGGTVNRLLRALTPGGVGGFSQFTPRARSVVTAAQAAAAGFGAGEIGSEHVLMALYAEPDGIAAVVLEELGADREALTAAVLAASPESTGPTRGQLPFGPSARRLLELTLAAALDLGHNYIGTEHILLGILGLGPDELGCKLLLDTGITADAAEAAIRRRLRQA
jgi:hypothetical protein